MVRGTLIRGRPRAASSLHARRGRPPPDARETQARLRRASHGVRLWPVSQASTSRLASASSSRFSTSTASAPRRLKRSRQGGHPRRASCQRTDRRRGSLDPRPASRDLDEHQAADGSRLLPRPPSPQAAAGARPADPHQRPHPQGQGEADRRQEEVIFSVWEAVLRSASFLSCWVSREASGRSLKPCKGTRPSPKRIPSAWCYGRA
ncbi:hypothetical protein Lal_00014250 [Lupinus albus]|nr:hypothetical protein Lal_00014250 [Lupinus albus]